MKKSDNSRARARALAQRMFRSSVGPFACGALALFAATAQAASPVPLVPDQQTWGRAITAAPLPGEGCFTADYPETNWKRVPCGPPHVPKPPAAGGKPPLTVGHGNDYEAVVSPAFIRSAIGSFPATNGVVSESDSSTGVSDVYSLQINSQYISGAPICAGATVPANCRAWEQFVFDDQGNSSQSSVYIQYWLLSYGNSCPAGWEHYPNSNSCTKNSNSNYLLFYVDIQNLTKIKLTASAVAGGNDRAALLTPTQAYAVANDDNVIGLANYWNAAEFNVFGGGGGSNANFNSGSTITVKLGLADGTTAAPTCTPHAGTTAEGNNLKLHKCRAGGGPKPYIRFNESN